MMNDWKVLSRKKLLALKVFDVYQEKAVCPRNNKAGNFCIIDYHFSWVTVVALTKNNNLIMIKQYRHGSKKNELELPGGCIEKGEDPLKAGIRELQEETGFVGNNAKIIGKVDPNPALQNNFCYTVLIENVEKTQETNMDDGEDITTLQIPYKNIKAMILDGSFSHALSLNALFFYELLISRC